MRVFRLKSIVEPFQRAFTELPWFGPVISAVLVAMLVNILTETLVTWGGPVLGWTTIIALALITIAFVYAYHISETRRRNRGLGPIDLPNPTRHRGLIFLFSNEVTLREAVKYHRPQQCWLLVTPEMNKKAHEAIGHLLSDFPEVNFDTIPITNLYNTQSCYQAVWNVYEHEARRLAIVPQEIVSDITGGTKPMTMGMIVACLEGGFHIEHVPTEYKSTGEPKGPLPPIEIRMQRRPSIVHYTDSDGL